MLYVDTSALLPFYRKESASETVEVLFLSHEQHLLISELVRVEFASALSRWVRMGELTEPQAYRAESAFHEDVSESRYRLARPNAKMFERAMHWLLTRRTSLNTLDALHLACAEASEAVLLTQDEALLDAANFFGIAARSVHQ
ncbi:type II toxin-antitoxin system VapC family toxin [Algiphilus sp. NNCM1]|uniref:type II toxin-antitoxin system VapC family toxin n=1 Tax=Algiphilus sp. TaxID=1872431 RepID=UPI001CA780E0|nr:type II toxin-antitoxin system VapC family toxin [Algiphilus sp.]MBY8965026.1 type II toxin-antitoxin system VapC family toxin [Algiphilus acroporae]MCI5104182.1 type II toxin-antitoxin system VapC family toxin [Algiphilus sp.]